MNSPHRQVVQKLPKQGCNLMAGRFNLCSLVLFLICKLFVLLWCSLPSTVPATSWAWIGLLNMDTNNIVKISISVCLA